MFSTLKYTYLRRIKGLSLPRDIIKAAVKRNKNRVAVVDGERAITYSDLYYRANRLAVSLVALGVSKGEKLAVILNNCQEFFEIRIACYLTGIVLVPLLTGLSREDYVFILNDCQVKALIYHPRLLEDTIEHLREETAVDKYIAVTEEENEGTYESLIEQGADFDMNIRLMEYDYASINFSSGTTGRPKGVELLQRSWMNSFFGYIAASRGVPLRRPVILHSLSLASAGGTSFLPAFFLGAKNVLTRRFDAGQSLSLVKEYKVDTLFMSPGYFTEFLTLCEARKEKFSFENIVVGTESVPKEIFKRAVKLFGHCVNQGYGMVEVLPPLTMLTRRDYALLGRIQDSIFLSVGRPSPGRLIKIVDEQGTVRPAGETGRIVVRSPSVSGGYYRNRILTESHFSQGWFYTNDYGYRDRRGYLYVLGREEDIISRSPSGWLFARDVQEEVYKVKGVLEVAVLPVAEGEYIVVVSPRENRGVLSEDVIAVCRDKFGEAAVPAKVVIVPGIEKNSSGKIDRKWLKKLLSGMPLGDKSDTIEIQ